MVILIIEGLRVDSPIANISIVENGVKTQLHKNVYIHNGMRMPKYEIKITYRCRAYRVPPIAILEKWVKTHGVTNFVETADLYMSKGSEEDLKMLKEYWPFNYTCNIYIKPVSIAKAIIESMAYQLDDTNKQPRRVLDEVGPNSLDINLT